MNETGFTPTEQWQLDDPLNKPVYDALAAMNSLDSGDLVKDLRKEVKHLESGITYAILRGNNPSEYSITDALVMFNPFANGATDNMLVRAEFIRQVARFSDIRDAEGKLKPVIMLASPAISHGSGIKFKKEEREQIKKGELGPAASELLVAVAVSNFGNVALFGFSQGADMAVAGARRAYRGNLDVSSLAVGDPAGDEYRTGLDLGKDFMKAGSKKLKESVNATSLKALKEAQGSPLGLGLFAASALKRANRGLWHGMTMNTFESHMSQLLREGIIDKIVAGYGSDSAIAKPEKIEPALKRLHDRDSSNKFISIRVNGANHTWGDRLTLLAKLYMTGVQ